MQSWLPKKGKMYLYNTVKVFEPYVLEKINKWMMENYKKSENQLHMLQKYSVLWDWINTVKVH